MQKLVFPILILLLSFSFGHAQTTLSIKHSENYLPAFSYHNQVLVEAPKEGLWSIATGWKNDWSDDWHNASADSMVKEGDWTILYGEIKLNNGTWKLRDAYRPEGDEIKCVRRYEWHSKEILTKVTLAIRWALPDYTKKIFMPGIIYYGNPSGYHNCTTCVATFDKDYAPEALFEEHRFSMPFVCAEIPLGNKIFGVSLHTQPSLAPYAHIADQWWSLALAQETIQQNSSCSLALLR